MKLRFQQGESFLLKWILRKSRLGVRLIFLKEQNHPFKTKKYIYLLNNTINTYCINIVL